MTRLPSRDALAEHRRRQREDGFAFPLPATSLGLPEVIVARVRSLDLFDKAAIQQLPDDVQGAVWDAIKTSQSEQATLQAIRGEAASLDEFSERGKHMITIANTFVIAAFIEPRVVATEAELATHPDAWVVTDIAAADRFEFLQINNDNDAGASKKLTLFRPGPVDDVEAGETQPVAATPIGDPEPVAERLS